MNLLGLCSLGNFSFYPGKRMVVCSNVFLLLLVILSVTSFASDRGITIKAKTTAGEEKTIPLYSGYYALVIGAGDYEKGWSKLPNPVKDALEVAEGLRTMGWEVDVVKNPDAVRLTRALNKLVIGPGQDPSKAVLVWFSGHGHTLEEADGSKLGYIIPVDAPDPYQDPLGFMEKAVSMRRIETIAKQIKSNHVLMAFDSCFSGAIFQLVRAKPSPYIQEKVAHPVREFITAGSENEQVPDESMFKTVFLQAVTQGFGDRNDDGYVTGKELGDYVQEKVVNYTRKAQHPQFGKIVNPKLDKGDFVFLAGGSAVIEEQQEREEQDRQPTSGSLKVRTEPRGAEIIVNNRRRGQAPVNLSGLEPDSYRIRAEKDGYEAQEKQVHLSSAALFS